VRASAPVDLILVARNGDTCGTPVDRLHFTPTAPRRRRRQPYPTSMRIGNPKTNFGQREIFLSVCLITFSHVRYRLITFGSRRILSSFSGLICNAPPLQFSSRNSCVATTLIVATRHHRDLRMMRQSQDCGRRSDECLSFVHTLSREWNRPVLRSWSLRSRPSLSGSHPCSTAYESHASSCCVYWMPARGSWDGVAPFLHEEKPHCRRPAS